MKKYNVMFVNIIDNGVESDKVIEKYVELITGNGGKVNKVDRKGINKLSYPKNGHTKGNYTILRFEATPIVTRLLDSTLKSDKEIITSIIISG